MRLAKLSFISAALLMTAAEYEYASAAVRVLTPTATLGSGPSRENSGVVASRRFEDAFWMIHDSGDEPRVYLVRRDGSVYGAERGTATYLAGSEGSTRDGYETPGVLVGGAIYVDWEDIALDATFRAADASVNGLRLLVLTYGAVWVFERASLNESFFSGTARRLAIKAEQVEAACFIDAAAEQILIADESAAVFYELSIDELEPVSASELKRRHLELPK
ncbi:MAG: hypothetical protein AAF648_04160 [Pseudomonadota bacterium]